ncbi:MAG: glycerol kinase, partial [Bacteroidaceae bacterium]|nr:glycerol kinase [Bacteroidaceae bacterium]
ALTGLGAPYWDSFAKGTITGITRGTTTAHIARAALEGIAFQTMDIVNAMKRDAGVELGDLKVDGGASRNNYLMQFQSDVLKTTVVRPKCVETTAKGAAYLAGLSIGFWKDLDEIKSQWSIESTFTPKASEEKVAELIAGWEDAVRRSLSK